MLWENFSVLAYSLNLPWIMIGDFNEISHHREKYGGRPASRIKMNCFNSFLNRARLLDLGFTGPKYTWTNCREIGSFIKTRIDREHTSLEWLNLFPETKIFHLPRLNSYHSPILLRTNPTHLIGHKPFRFEPFWIKHHSFWFMPLRLSNRLELDSWQPAV